MLELVTVTGTPMRGAGWYGTTTGLHTISMRILNFQGQISVQASLATVPTDADWISVLPDGAAFWQFPTAEFLLNNPVGGQTGTVGFNFICNAVWIRATVDRSYINAPIASLGTVDSILVNY